MTPISLKQMSQAVASDDGKGIRFTFLTHANKTMHFVCPPEAVPEITARLIAAMEQAALRRTPKPTFLLAPIVTSIFEVGLSQDKKQVAVKFGPTQSSRIGFAFSSDIARQLAGGLMEAAAKVDPVNPKTIN
ncbi:MAG: hypothetical protein ACT4N4_05930 [Rhodospirillales bacterium]